MELVPGPDGRPRCEWALAAPEFLDYHDKEWGFPVDDDIRLFEKLSLEAFQSGLSWRTILAKRENFRAAFQGFDFARIAKFTEEDIERLLGDAGIVRHRGKIEAVINNAQHVEALVGAGSLAGFVWQFEPARRAPRNEPASTTSESVELARQLKKHGWKFVGPTTVYAFMQAMGLVNDHMDGCVIREAVEEARGRFTPPPAAARAVA